MQAMVLMSNRYYLWKLFLVIKLIYISMKNIWCFPNTFILHRFKMSLTYLASCCLQPKFPK